MGEARSQTVTRERDDQGRIKETYPLDDVQAALAEIGPATTREVEERLGCAYATAYEKLRELEDDGRITSRKVANARLWSVAEPEGDE